MNTKIITEALKLGWKAQNDKFTIRNGPMFWVLWEDAETDLLFISEIESDRKFLKPEVIWKGKIEDLADSMSHFKIRPVE